jgi:hypothetical protein
MTARGPRVLVLAASRHGAITEIGAAPARGLSECDAALPGSAVHAGHWLDPVGKHASGRS